MQSILFCLLAILSIDAQGGSKDTTQIETRYGTVEVATHSDTLDIRFRGKVVRSVDAPDALLYRITPKDQREFVLVDN